MSKRHLSQTPSAIAARERRLEAFVRRAEAEWNAEVRSFMDKGLSFDDAWIAAGGAIYTDQELTQIASKRRSA